MVLTVLAWAGSRELIFPAEATVIRPLSAEMGWQPSWARLSNRALIGANQAPFRWLSAGVKTGVSRRLIFKTQ